MSPLAVTAFENSLRDSVRVIFTRIQNETKRITQVKQFISHTKSKKEPSIKFDQIKEAIFEILLLGVHENNDSLGVKLMAMVKSVPNPEVMHLFPLITVDNRQHIENLFIARRNVMFLATKESLSDWSNFTCIAEGRDYVDSNESLKSVLLRNSNLTMLDKLNRRCSIDGIVMSFLSILDRYYPLKYLGPNIQ